MIPIFKSGQKVWCYYHSTKRYSPPMCGKVLFKLPFKIKHRFAFSIEHKNNKCDWYLVRMQNGMIIFHPETCLTNLRKAIEEHNKHGNIKPEGAIQIDAWKNLVKWQQERIAYLNEK